jgi:hypothetical protein
MNQYTQEQQLTICFSFAERPIKLLLNQYFRSFGSQDVVKFCRTMGLNVAKVPKVYRENGDMSNILESLNQKYLDHTSLFKIPPRAGEARLSKPVPDASGAEVENETWFLYLELQPSGGAWDEERCKQFGEEGSKQLKKLMGDMFKMASVVFGTLKSLNVEAMNTLMLVPNTENVTLELRDTRFPNLRFGQAIGFGLRRPSPEEDVPPLLGTL